MAFSPCLLALRPSIYMLVYSKRNAVRIEAVEINNYTFPSSIGT